MPKEFDKIGLYRITHIDNLEYILKSGRLTAPNHPDHNANYIGIGDMSLIEKRSSKKIPLSPFGTFRDYISFYFSKRSVMLYVIQNGYNNVPKRDPAEIIYLVTSYVKVKDSSIPFVFYDGHAYESMSVCYKDDSALDEIDWHIIRSKDWRDTEEDQDRKRRKSAELLIFKEFPISNILGIAVYNKKAQEKTNSILKSLDVSLDCKIYQDWYY